MATFTCLECRKIVTYVFDGYLHASFCGRDCAVRHKDRKRELKDIELGPAGKGEWSK